MSVQGIEINTYYELYTQCKLERDLLKQELQKTREQLNTCEKLLMRFVPDEKTIQWQQRELYAKQYFKDKENKE